MTVKADGITYVDNSGGGGTNVNIAEVGGVPVTSPLPVTFVPSGLPQDVNLMEVGGAAFDLGQENSAGSLPVVLALDQSSIPVVVGPGSQIVVVASALPTGAATEAKQTQPGVDIGDVTVNNGAGGAAVNIQDGGNTITVDGTVGLTPGTIVGITGSVAVTGPLTDTELRATPVPVSGTVAVTQPVTVNGTVTANAGTNLNTSLLNLESTQVAVAASLSVIDDWDESDRAKVNPIVGQAGIQGAAGAVSANTTRVVIATDQTVIPVQGNIAHDSPVSTNVPVSISAVSQDMDSSAPPNRVNAEADVTRVSSDRDGAIFSHPHGPQIINFHENSSSQLTDQAVFASAGSGLSNYITDIVISSGAATALNIFFEEGSTIVLGPYYLEAINGRGVCIHFQTPKKLTAATALTVTTSAAIAHSIEVNGFIAP